MLSKLINPHAVAVIGASANPEKVGYQILSNLTSQYQGQIFPVNPKGGEILGRKVINNIKDAPQTVDLAVICVPADLIPPVLRDCAKAGVRSVAIISAGFSETGDRGTALQDEIIEICKKSGISMLGPNCLGLINMEINLNASFADAMPAKGNVSFVSQSGAMVSAMIDWSRDSGVGFSKIFSLGNKAMLGEAEILDYLYNDNSTEVIIAYLENLEVNKALTEKFVRYSKTKPTVVLFGGKSPSGANAATSHTGSLVSSYLAVETYLKQAGIIMAESLEDLFIYSTLFSKYNNIKGNKVGIITNAGGPSIAASDSIEKYNLKLAGLSKKTQSKIHTVLRPEASVRNPVDVLGDATDLEYKAAIKITADDPNVDALLILLTPQSSTQIEKIAEHVANLKTKKPVIAAFIGGESVTAAFNIIRSSDKVIFSYPEIGIRALKALSDFSNAKSSIKPANPGDETFFLQEKNKLMKKYRLPILEYIEVSSKADIQAAAQKIGYPAVLKTAKKEISHKSDAGGVVLNIGNEEELLKAFDEVGFPAVLGKMIKGKHEIFLGVKKNPKIGTVIAFGGGGIYSEVYKDLSYRIAPISKEVALEMIRETKIGAILAGARGQKPYNLDKVADIIVNTARFADNFRNINEIDFNPVIADEDDFHMVDTRIIAN